MDLTVNSWTRSKNDSLTAAYAASRNSDVFKHITFTPEYLQEGSCLTGNHANCTVFRDAQIEHEQRLGLLTNLNEIQRASTNDTTLGILTTPDFSSGRLIDPRMLDTMSDLEWTATHASRVSFPSSSQMNEHHMLHSVHTADTGMAPPPPILMNDELRISSRVTRRNMFAERNGCRAV